jgi:hypothetical protein
MLNIDQKVLVSYTEIINQNIELLSGKIVTPSDDENVQLYKGFLVENNEVVPTFNRVYNQEMDIPISFGDVPDSADYESGKSNIIRTTSLDWIDGQFCLDNEKANQLYNHCGPGCGDNCCNMLIKMKTMPLGFKLILISHLRAGFAKK